MSLWSPYASSPGLSAPPTPFALINRILYRYKIYLSLHIAPLTLVQRVYIPVIFRMRYFILVLFLLYSYVVAYNFLIITIIFHISYNVSIELILECTW